MIKSSNTPPAPAKIISHSKGTTVLEGSNATFFCDVIGSPSPVVTWTINKVFDTGNSLKKCNFQQKKKGDVCLFINK